MKSITEIYEEMRELFGQETGVTLHPGSEMAVRLYAIAAQLYGLYVQNKWTLEQCFPQSAKGEYLDKHAALRGLSRKAATKAKGTLRFAVEGASTEALKIPCGTICMTVGMVRFETIKEAVLPSGGRFVDVPAQAVEEGEGGNVPTGSVRLMAVAPVGINTCTNPEAFVGGAAQEGEEALRGRIMDSYQRMPNGANAAYYEREAKTIAQVVAVNVIGRARGRGTVDVVVAGANGNPGAEVIAAVQAHLQRQREIAVDVQTRPPTEVSFDLSVQLTLKSGAEAQSIKREVEQILLAYFDGSRLGESVLCAKLGHLMYSVPGVQNYQILSPKADVNIQAGQLPKLKTLRVEVLA